MAQETLDAGPVARLLEGARWAALATSLLVIAGAALAFASVTYDYYGYGVREFGRNQTIAFALAVACMLGGAAAQVALGIRSRAETLVFWGVVAQAALASQVIRVYEIDARIFYDVVALLLLFGFIAHHYTAPRLRPAVFLALGIAVVLAVLAAAQPMAAVMLIGLALLLFTIASLPLELHWRVGMLACVGAGLAALHVGWIDASWSNIVVPLVASMFMFRLIVFLYDTHNGRGPKSLWQRLGYFFLPPNPIFPFFPVVDFATFGRSYYNEDALVIYQRGVNWIVRGVIHLLIYRIVYQFLTIAPEAVASPAELLQFTVTNFALYFRISGLFHLIIGVLLLFGYNLPETHSSFYLSNSFIDFWRRINIYWKEFMQKMFFTPAFTRFKKLGASHLAAISCAVVVTFVATWALHSYQWFWMRGSILLTWPDVLFWTFLGVVLILQTRLEDARQGRPRPASRALIGPRTHLVVRTVCTLLTICLLWSFWTSSSIGSWLEMLARAGVAPAFSPGLETSAAAWLTTLGAAAVVVVLVLVTMGVTFGLAAPGAAPQRRKPPASPLSRWLSRGGAVWLLCLALILPQLAKPRLGIDAQLALERVSSDQLNARDQATMTRGYYEELTDTSRFNSQLWEAMMFRPNNFTPLADQAGLRDRGDYLEYEYVPDAEFVANGVTLRINRWGMRDQDYELEKPANAVRMAVVEASRASGQGVEQDELFEALLERRLNGDLAGSGRVFESLNFSVDGQLPIGRYLTLEEKVWRFAPDIVLYIGGFNDDPTRTIARAFRAGSPAPYPLIEDVIARAGLDRAMSIERMMALLEPYRFEVLGDVYRRFVESCREHGATPVWLYLPLLTGDDGENEDAASVQHELAREAGFVMVDIADIYDAHPMEALQIGPWDIGHPNALGHRLIADALHERLTTLHRAGEIDLGLAR